MNEFEHEPIPGLPAALPAGETILWQGAPDWRRLAIEAYHVRKVASYFAILAAWSMASAIADGEAARGVQALGWLLAFAAVGLAILLALAWTVARTTIYTITSHRVVIRHGVALPMAVNLPFSKIEQAAARIDATGGGDIPLALSSRDHLAWLVMWPHARPWRVARAEPMLRALADAQTAARILVTALQAASADAAAPKPAPVASEPAPLGMAVAS